MQSRIVPAAALALTILAAPEAFAQAPAAPGPGAPGSEGAQVRSPGTTPDGTVSFRRAAREPFALQQPEITSMSFRKEYLEKFPWTLSNTTAGDAMMLRILVESRGARNGVEVGTNTGYGAINMGIGFERTGGRLTTIEIDPRTAATARSHLAKVGLDKVVTVVEGDALKILPALPGTFDFVFIDARKPDYLKYLKALEAKLKPGAVVVADNVIDYARQMPDFLEYIQSSPLYDTQIIRASMQKNDGMSVSVKIR